MRVLVDTCIAGQVIGKQLCNVFMPKLNKLKDCHCVGYFYYELNGKLRVRLGVKLKMISLICMI